MTTQISTAYCTRGGRIIITKGKMPDDMLKIATGAPYRLRKTISVLARWSYPSTRGGKDSKPLVPGVPEAENYKAAVDAVIALSKRVNRNLEAAK